MGAPITGTSRSRRSSTSQRYSQHVLDVSEADQLPEMIREPVFNDQRLRDDICWSVFDA